ncbi:MAG: hypothetical protein Q7U54_16035 [Bacteroidales bacterium]|nr:hypothetical protein [Bacteroidales bacterium]
MKNFDKNMPIKSYKFYSNFADKTKANWLAYEFANEVYDVILEFFKAKDYGIPIKHINIEAFSIFIAKGYVDKFRIFTSGTEPTAIHSTTPETNIFNSLDPKTQKKLQDAINNCFYSHLDKCALCPTDCIHDFDGICYMFDKGPY